MNRAEIGRKNWDYYKTKFGGNYMFSRNSYLFFRFVCVAFARIGIGFNPACCAPVKREAGVCLLQISSYFFKGGLMKTHKLLGIIAIVGVIGLVLAGCSGSSALVGRWRLVEGPTRGNPENMELLKDGTGVSDGVGGMTWKVENSRFYLTTPPLYRYNAASWSYTVSG